MHIDSSTAACRRWGVSAGDRLRRGSDFGTVLGVGDAPAAAGVPKAGSKHTHGSAAGQLWVQFDGRIGASTLDLEPDAEGAEALAEAGYALCNCGGETASLTIE